MNLKQAERKAEIERRRKKEAKKKLEAKLEKQKKERERKIAEKKEAVNKKAKAEVDKAYKKAIYYYKAKEASKYLQQVEIFNKLLENEIFTSEYVKKTKEKLEEKKADILKLHERERAHRSEMIKKEERMIAKEQERLEQQRKENLLKLEKKIQLEEERISREKEREYERLKKARLQDIKKKRIKTHDEILSELNEKKSDRRIAKDNDRKKRSVKVDVEYEDPLLKQIRESRVKRTRELENSIESKREFYEQASVDAEQDFKNTLADLYERAVKLFNEKSYIDANRMFTEIKKMSPTYKKTQDYINKSED